jgi:serine/threonine protein kinase
MTHARTMQVCGTGPYMPPEYANRGEVSAHTDAFAFGIMAIDQLLTGLHQRSAISDQWPWRTWWAAVAVYRVLVLGQWEWPLPTQETSAVQLRMCLLPSQPVLVRSSQQIQQRS